MAREDLTGTKLGNYRLERLLGAGRMGVVYLARDEALLRPTAVKLLSWQIPPQEGYDPEAWFLAEARNVARINHPSVVQIYSVARQAGHCYIAMEYVDGQSADSLVAKAGALPPDRATAILIQVAAALQAAHNSNVIHRDIKPENLLIRSDDVAKLGDFGMATHMAGSQPVDTRRAGTPYYTAPEIWQGAAASRATDIYALGATYYYLMVGHPPVLAKDIEGLINAHLQGNIEDIRKMIPGIHEKCGHIIRKCMARSPQDRYASAQELEWEAKGLLRELRHSGFIPAVGRATAKTPSVSPPPKPSTPLPAWAEFFGLTSLPFADAPTGHSLYKGDPFHSVRNELAKHLKARDGRWTLLVGDQGSGRTTLVHHLLEAQSTVAPVAYTSVQSPSGIVRQAARAFGCVEEGVRPEAVINSLLAQLEARAEAETKIPLLVIDDMYGGAEFTREIALLVDAAKATRYFNILCIGTPKVERELTEKGISVVGKRNQVVHLSPLNGQQAHAYLGDRLRACQSRKAQMAIVTPDAALILCHKAAGALAKLNELATRMLYLAAANNHRVLSSWYAWATEDFAIPPGNVPLSAPKHPETWPTAEVIEQLNQYRRENNMPPRLLDASDSQGPPSS